MAPARTSARRHGPYAEQEPFPRPTQDTTDAPLPDDLFIDPMLGTPLAIYIEKDVDDRHTLVQLITKHGGTVSPGYSGVPYILVDPYKPSGQNLWRQYASKKGKIVLNARWVHECVKAGQLQTFHEGWAGCRVTGNETAPPAILDSQTASAPAQVTISSPTRRRSTRQTAPPPEPVQSQPQQQPQHPLHTAPPLPTMAAVDLVHQPFPSFYGAPIQPDRGLHPATAAPPQTWQATAGIAPQQTHITPPQPPPSTAHPHLIHRPPYREETWDNYETTHPQEPITGPTPSGYDYRYRDPQTWVPTNQYYEPPAQYEQPYEQPTQFVEDPTTSAPQPPAPPSQPPAPSATPDDSNEKEQRGRRRTRVQPPPATPASSLVVGRNPPARSPTPPTRVIKSTYGGNLFTAEDIEYLKKYIDYCQEQGLVLSLREICERIAVKAPHHTFYSWRRYCNKHQIRLGGYMMNLDRSESPGQDGDQDMPEDPSTMRVAGPGPGTMQAILQQLQSTPPVQRNRSPTPPRALFRSTTGKGVAFTPEDVTFLVKFMDYRKSQGRLDMVAFWKEVAAKAPHHSRASWMKFWRRHRHELQRSEGDEPLPQPPDKKMRYSREDDILLAKYFATKPDGTSDKIFQAFGRMHPHHPWKGWQEHHRIHKAKIDHLIQLLENGENVDEPEVGGPAE